MTRSNVASTHAWYCSGDQPDSSTSRKRTSWLTMAHAPSRSVAVGGRPRMSPSAVATSLRYRSRSACNISAIPSSAVAPSRSSLATAAVRNWTAAASCPAAWMRAARRP